MRVLSIVFLAIFISISCGDYISTSTEPSTKGLGSYWNSMDTITHNGYLYFFEEKDEDFVLNCNIPVVPIEDQFLRPIITTPSLSKFMGSKDSEVKTYIYPLCINELGVVTLISVDKVQDSARNKWELAEAIKSGYIFKEGDESTPCLQCGEVKIVFELRQ